MLTRFQPVVRPWGLGLRPAFHIFIDVDKMKTALTLGVHALARLNGANSTG
jgi:hypothetical protein